MKILDGVKLHPQYEDYIDDFYSYLEKLKEDGISEAQERKEWAKFYEHCEAEEERKLAYLTEIVPETKLDQEIKEKVEQEVEQERRYGDDLLKKFLEVFNKRSYYNEIPGEAMFRIILSVLLKDKKIYKRNGKLLNTFVHLFFIQDTGCLSGDTQIKLSSGTCKIKDLPDISEVVTYNFEKNKEESKVARKVCSGKKKTYLLKLKSGRTVKASVDHIFFTKNKSSEVVEKKLSEIKAGDELAVTFDKNVLEEINHAMG